MSVTTPKRTSRDRESSDLRARALLPFELIETNKEVSAPVDAPAAPDEFPFAKAVFGSTQSIAEVLENIISATKVSIDAALHRFNSQRLGKTLLDAHRRGIRIRLLTDRSKYEKSQATRELLAACEFSFRTTRGREGEDSKMHHKFVVVDGRLVITGSYNWTFASEVLNHENVLLLREPRLIKSYSLEFDALWAISEAITESTQ